MTTELKQPTRAVPPLEDGDHLSRDEFERRYAAMPELKKAELIQGVVRIPSDSRTRSVNGVPSLQPGDHLSRDEFVRRYEAMPGLKKAELIDGVVYMPSPVSNDGHGAPHAKLVGWLVNYEARTPGVQVSDNPTVRLGKRNEPQPDALLRILPEYGGQTLDDAGFVSCGPEWAGEVASSSASYDLHEKKETYRNAGVHEYVVVRVLDREVDWFVLRGGQYERLAAGVDGILRSETFPGLWLDAAALVSGDTRRLLAVLQQGLESPEHADFVRRLAETAATPLSHRPVA